MATSLDNKLSQIQQARDNIKTALASKGQVVGKDIRTYAEAVRQIETGGGGVGDVKLFSSVQEMNNDPTAQLDDLAVVYDTQVSECTFNSQFSKFICPKTVILEEALQEEQYIEVQFRKVDETTSGYCDCWGEFSKTRFSLDCWVEGEGEEKNYRVEYESTDGLTYTRTVFSDRSGDLVGDEIDLGQDVKYSREEQNWDNRIGKFIHCSNSIFNGFYKYGPYIDGKLYITDYDIVYDTETETYKFINTTGTKLPDIDLTPFQEDIDINYCFLVVTEEQNGVITKVDNYSGYNMLKYNNHMYYVSNYNRSTTSKPSDTTTVTVQHLDLVNKTRTTETKTLNIQYVIQDDTTPKYAYFYPIVDLTNTKWFMYGRYFSQLNFVKWTLENNEVTAVNLYQGQPNNNVEGYITAPSQLTAQIKDLQIDKIAYSKDGVITRRWNNI